MNKSIKIWHILLSFFVFISVFRFEEILNCWNYLLNLSAAVVTGTFVASAHINIEIADLLFQSVLIVAAPVLLIVFRRRFRFIFFRTNITTFFLLMLAACFVFAPLLTFESPELSKNISVTKLLQPFSEVKKIYLSIPSDNDDYLIQLKQKISFRDIEKKIEYADSILVSKKIICFQNNSSKEYNSDEVLMSGQKPVVTSRLFLLGTDEHGRDVLVRIIYGSRISVFIGLLAVLLSFVIGVSAGFTAGYSGGFLDSVLSRITDLFLAFPIIFFVVLILALFGSSITSIIIVLGLSGWMSLFKIVKAEVISIKTKEYFQSAKMIGLKNYDLLTKEVLPVIMVPVSVNLIFLYGNVILSESALSYLGLGITSDYPSWGKMIEAGQEYIVKAWWLFFFPGLMLVLTILTANNLGRKINLYYNPRLK